jgi:hypothetical protein
MTNSKLTTDTYAKSSNLAGLNDWKKTGTDSDFDVYALRRFAYALTVFTITVLRKDRDKLRATLLKTQSRVGMVLTPYEESKTAEQLESYVKARTKGAAQMAETITQLDEIFNEYIMENTDNTAADGYQAVLEVAAPYIEELGIASGIRQYATAKAITSNATCPKEFADCKVHIKLPASEEHACFNLRIAKPKSAAETVTAEANDTDIPF